MDYETRATSRNELRHCAKFFRAICGFTSDEPIDPIALLDKLPDLDGFADVRYEIVYNDTLPGNVPAQYKPDDFSNRKARPLTEKEYKKYRKFFRGI